jgi:hypothetical protein
VRLLVLQPLHRRHRKFCCCECDCCDSCLAVAIICRGIT